MSVQGFRAYIYPTLQAAQQQKELGAGTYGQRELLKMLRVALVPLVLMGSAALPLRAPARGAILSTRSNKPWRGCPEEGDEKLTGFSEAMAMFHDGSSSKSDKSGSTSAPAGEDGLDGAASKGLATSVAATMARLQLYKNHGTDGSKSDESGSTRAVSYTHLTLPTKA